MKIHWFFKVLIILIALFTIWILFYFGLPAIIPAQKVRDASIYGLIMTDQIWEGNIQIIGDIYSPTNTTITIMPGTTVSVAIKDDKSNFYFLPWQKKSGINTKDPERGVNTGEPFWDESEKIRVVLNKLFVKGNFSNPVIFRSGSENPSPYDFNLIRIKSGQIDNAYFSDYRRFEIGGEVLISNSSFKNTGECSLCLSEGNPRIYNNQFEKSLRESIWINRSSPEISNNLFQNLEGDGVRINAERLSSPIITNNDFEMPQRIAIDFISGGQKNESVIARNIFSGSSQIKIACDTNIKIRDNVILGQLTFSNGCDGEFVFGPNYWGTPDPSTIIKEKILNKYDSFSIKIPSILLLPPKEAGRK